MSAVTYSRFPAAIRSERRSERRAAVVVADGLARVAVSTGQGVQVVEEFAVADVTTANRRTTIVGEDGTEWTVERGDGCGCGSKLRTWYREALGQPRRSGRG